MKDTAIWCEGNSGWMNLPFNLLLKLLSNTHHEPRESHSSNRSLSFPYEKLNLYLNRYGILMTRTFFVIKCIKIKRGGKKKSRSKNHLIDIRSWEQLAHVPHLEGEEMATLSAYRYYSNRCNNSPEDMFKKS